MKLSVSAKAVITRLKKHKLLTTKQLAEAFDVSSNSMRRTLNLLHEKGFIELSGKSSTGGAVLWQAVKFNHLNERIQNAQTFSTGNHYCPGA